MASRRTPPSSEPPTPKPPAPKSAAPRSRAKAKSVATPEPLTVPPDVTMEAMPPSKARAKRAAVGAPTVSADARRGMIAESAYLRAERRGFAPGGEDEDWIAAEAEVDQLLKADQRTPQ